MLHDFDSWNVILFIFPVGVKSNARSLAIYATCTFDIRMHVYTSLHVGPYCEAKARASGAIQVAGSGMSISGARRGARAPGSLG